MKTKEMRDTIITDLAKGGAAETVYLGKHSTYGKITQCIPSGIPMIDRIIAKDTSGLWGLPSGRTTFIAGKPASGKTTLCYHFCAGCQRIGGIAYYFDAEHRLDAPYATKVGVNVNELLYNAPDCLEDVLENIKRTVGSIARQRKKEKSPKAIGGIPVLIVVDSVSVATKNERNADEYGKGGKGEHARLISQFLRDITPDISRFNIAIIFVCQIKNKINMGPFAGRGNNETFLAENALRFHCSIGLRSQRIATIKSQNKIRIGDVDLFSVTKSSCLPPNRQAEAELYYGEGFDYYSSLCDLLVQFYGVVINGSWYSIEKLGLKWQGKNGLGKILSKDPKMQKKVETLLQEPMRMEL